MTNLETFCCGRTVVFGCTVQRVAGANDHRECDDSLLHHNRYAYRFSNYVSIVRVSKCKSVNVIILRVPYWFAERRPAAASPLEAPCVGSVRL